MSGMVMVPWYATGFRGDTMEKALGEISHIALRYGASGYRVVRGDDDRYRFMQMLDFESHADWDRYWGGPEMVDFRIRHSGQYQIPVLYGWWSVTAEARIGENGGNGQPAGEAAVAASH
jgi:hypothetical protein